MRKLILILFGVTLLAMLSNTAMGQSFGNLGLWDMYSIPPQRVIMGAGDKTTRPDTSAALEIRGRKRALFLRGVVHRDSVYAPKIGMIVMDSSDYHLYFRGVSGWVALDSSSGGGADSSIFLTVYDASQTYQPIGTYLTPSDTTGKWWSVSNVFIRPSDTAAMLMPYLRKIDTTNKWLPIGTVIPSITGLQPYSDTGTTDATRYWVGQQGYTTPQTFNQTLALDSVGLHQLGISNPNASIAAHFQGNNTNYRMAINTSSNGAGLQGYNNALNAVRMITIQGGGGNVRIGTGVDNGTGIQLARQVRMDSLTTGTGSDSLIVVSGGILKRIEPPSLSSYVPYTGATNAVDLGVYNLTTLGRVTGAIFRFTNPTSYTDVTSSATTPRSNTLPDRSGEILVPTGTATNGYVIQSVSGTPTWTAPSGGGGGSALTITSPLTGSSFDGSAPVTIGLAGLTSLGSADQITGMNSAATAYEYKTVSSANGASVTHTANSITVGTPFRPYRYKVDNVSLLTQANTTVFTTDANKGRFIVTNWYVHLTAYNAGSGSVSINIGYNAANYNDVINGGSINMISQVNAVNEYGFGAPVAGTSVSIPASTAVVFRVATAGTGTTATATVYIVGFYENE